MSAMISILGVTRKSRFSPNHVGNDAAIFNEVILKLTEKGASVEICNEDEFLAATTVKQENILTMGRTKTLVKKLQILQSSGAHVLNSGFGIENCFRKNMTLKLLEGGIPYPKSIVISTVAEIQSVIKNRKGKGVWIKRGDFQAIHKE